MEKIIATVVGIILVLGLISYAVLGQAAQVKDTGDKAGIEQQKISLMLQDSNVVTGNIVKDYASQENIDISVNMVDDNSTYSTETQIYENVKDGALFEMTKSYNANGDLEGVSFEQVDLSK